MSMSDEEFRSDLVHRTVEYIGEIHRNPDKLQGYAAESWIRSREGYEEPDSLFFDAINKDTGREIEIKSAIVERRDGSPGKIKIERTQYLNGIKHDRNIVCCVVDRIGRYKWRILDWDVDPIRAIDDLVINGWIKEINRHGTKTYRVEIPWTDIDTLKMYPRWTF